eukprot:CAMPEP_0206435248 /NCGR_PEP_ID=MMETSP0324_2-20121206/9717_1 /ASSEMBLY_ACC=CAM_ASM_000836 /TAXON_ID=2866 /ORGANISM="Crypthecodinium cohnii, Strain Seligo" /LENGTH=120 /DNA_ID=CAMNT_0053902071 /DNA_START=549 /DNA_END=911 /DNA_ORIENTATION=-
MMPPRIPQNHDGRPPPSDDPSSTFALIEPATGESLLRPSAFDVVSDGILDVDRKLPPELEPVLVWSLAPLAPPAAAAAAAVLVVVAAAVVVVGAAVVEDEDDVDVEVLAVVVVFGSSKFV